MIAIANANSDFGIVPAASAQAEALALANETGEAVTLRDPVSDEILGTVEPKAKRAKAGKAAKVTKAKGKGPRTPRKPPRATRAVEVKGKPKGKVTAPRKLPRAKLAKELSPMAKAKIARSGRKARRAKLEEGFDETLAALDAGKPIDAKGLKPAGSELPPAPSTKTPKGMVVRILELAERAEGVSPQELNDLTTWKGAPWKWLFQNPQRTGYCDRWGFTLTLLPGNSGARSVRYQVTKA